MDNMFSIRTGCMADAADMARIYDYYVAESEVIFSNRLLDAIEMRDKLERLGVGERFPFLIAEAHGKVTGYAYAHLWQPDPVYGGTWELTMYLDHECRGMGIGTALMDRLVEECRKGGAHMLLSCVTQGNQACERMCARAGFKLAGVLPETGFKFGRYLNDALYYLLLE